MTFIAQYRTECELCGFYIQKGDEAAYVAFGEVAHVVCPKEVDELLRAVCPRCFMEKSVSGECGCP